MIFNRNAEANIYVKVIFHMIIVESEQIRHDVYCVQFAS